MTQRYDVAELRGFAAALFEHAGLDADKARVTADILVEGDLLGHTTHGLALLPAYLDAAQSGAMRGTGAPELISATSIVETWDGKRLPGPFLVATAADLASRRAAEFGLSAVSIRRACHIGCLAAYLKPITDRGQMLIIACSDPSVASVAPFGGTRRVYTPNPLAAGWPSPSGPVMIDVSMSITTNGMTGRLRAEGKQFEHPWLLDAAGAPTRDPNAFYTNPPGSLQPLGGSEAGHKGYALGLLLEALTSALAGHGRADHPTEWGASVLVLVIDPARFGGAEAFLRETGWMEDAVHSNPPGPAGQPVRLPGERGLALRKSALANGVELHPSLPAMLAERGAKAGIAVPQPITA
jgi:LDH2 family malate/lactate/ureidoglycolate dehydrogenase